MSMTQVNNFYVIVNRVGTRPVTCWAPAVSQASEQTSKGAGPAYSLAREALRESESSRGVSVDLVDVWPSSYGLV